jgi:hypothetical protein
MPVPTVRALLAAFVWAAPFAAGAGPAKFSCPEQQRVRVNLDDWKYSLERAATWAEHNRILSKLRLKPAWIDRPTESAPTCNEITQVEEVQILSAPLSGATEPDLLVEARFHLCHGQGMKILRVQVLRPLAEGEWCALGDALAVERDASTLPCPDGGSRSPRTFAFLTLTDAKRKTIEVRDRWGSCEGPRRDERLELSYWNVESTGLRRIFSILSFERARQPDTGEDRVVQREISMAPGPYPRRILATEQTFTGEEEKPRIKKKSFVFRQGKYTEE